MSTPSSSLRGAAPLLQAILNLSRFHREHEKFYASAPRERAIALQRHARTLQALADRWSTVQPTDTGALSPFQGAEDLNDPAATQLDGVLFMEGEGRPAELTQLIRNLRTAADDCAATGQWLDNAMQASWEMAAALVGIDELADVLGQRHRIIINDWQAAQMNALIARLLQRAADVLEHVDFTPAALRRDLAGGRHAVGHLYSAAELINHAADLYSDSAGLVHDNEPRWRHFRQHVAALVAATDAAEHD
jgi:hypothetical protein